MDRFVGGAESLDAMTAEVMGRMFHMFLGPAPRRQSFADFRMPFRRLLQVSRAACSPPMSPERWPCWALPAQLR